MFKQLSGNPTSIVFLAACYANPFKANKLTDLYERILHEKNIEDDESENQSQNAGKPKISKNNMSLNLTTEASI